ncbi:(deoxy)nucleoside triphosphate pyrophosphohydrolase [Nocardioides bizhenqiangii]|uniref:8-oxo-dGTP diphosphatase n=1 Tax=Nocardioides bizhenqiangii TaxID=3095076 RepID=A0ABZ0ZSI5_9ACTN|nr:(deoxy)nucleoside triphosphate pyrophosphohydrolase [Nocardioides sp. HM61]WQQ27280.1 (deoxy)nucleoside triphosphate pyrophosphohydrolase [Nocardioides sp. HM61]
MKKHINVVGAVVVRGGRVLCAQRGAGALDGLWEFPGGKIELDETPRSALEREIVEELLCRVEVGAEVATTTHEYDFAIVTLTTFYCELVEGEPQLTEHADVRWCTPSEMAELPWAPADVPAVDQLRIDLGA